VKDDTKKSRSNVERFKKKANHLNPIKHPQSDFFIADIFDAVSLQLDMDSMEYPLFALKAGDIRERNYEQNGFKIKIAPHQNYGMATIHDKDIWIYCISKLMQAKREGKPLSRTVHFTVYDYLKTTNRDTGGVNYERTKNSLDRLASTRITTEYETDNRKIASGFGLIDAWKIIHEKDGRMIRVSVTLPDWLYSSIESQDVLTISSDYFRLRKPLDRRIYEIARKHCGHNKSWTFSVKILYERSGSSTSLSEFRRAIKSLAESNQLPDYAVEFDSKKNQITFYKRVNLKELANELNTERDPNTIDWVDEKPQENKSSKRKKITELEASQMAKPGEEWAELIKRLSSKYHIVFEK